MLFNSLEFLIFFPLVTFLYFFLPHKVRWIHLLIASCIFYIAFIPIYILILFFTILIDYFAGILIEGANGKGRKWFLVMSIIANVGVLCIFKYYNFFIDNVNVLLHQFHITTHGLKLLNIILPIGLSFHTFQAMSYTIEVYRGNQKAERHMGIYALYVMFYPQLVAGPIERPQNLLPQFREVHHPDYENIICGLRLLLWGMFKKVVIADRLSLFVDPVFNNPHRYSSLTLLLASVLFAFQIFCDFSGYSDIAIGVARVMGFKLMQNFNSPYHSKNVSEFWKRWHISLSTWFKDYLYISLGGNRVSVPRLYFNLFFVFLVSGFWHGANWTFIMWGALHGFYLIFAIITKKQREQLNSLFGVHKYPKIFSSMQIAITFILVTFAWVFFRANNIKDALFIIKHIFFCVKYFFHLPAWNDLWWGKFSKMEVLLPFLLVVLLEGVHYIQANNRLYELWMRNKYLHWATYYILAFSIIFLGVFKGRQFIYFQF